LSEILYTEKATLSKVEWEIIQEIRNAREFLLLYGEVWMAFDGGKIVDVRLTKKVDKGKLRDSQKE